MAPSLEAVAADLSTPGAFALREFVGPYGVPDMVLVSPDRDRLSERLAADLPPLLNEVDAGIIAVASAPSTTSQIAARLRWPERAVQRRLPILGRRGYVAKVGKFVAGQGRPQHVATPSRLHKSRRQAASLRELPYRPARSARPPATLDRPPQLRGFALSGAAVASPGRR